MRNLLAEWEKASPEISYKQWLEHQLDAANQRIAELELMIGRFHSGNPKLGDLTFREQIRSQLIKQGLEDSEAKEAAEAKLAAAVDALVAILDLPHDSAMRVHAHNALTRLGAIARIDAPAAGLSDAGMEQRCHDFFKGAKWWEWIKTNATMWQSDQHAAYEAAKLLFSGSSEPWPPEHEPTAEPSDTELILWELDGDSGVKAFMKSDPNRCAHGGTIAEAVGDLVMSQSNTFAARVQSATQPGKDPRS